jgi:transcriptional regulator with XRE-family HTH domain
MSDITQDYSFGGWLRRFRIQKSFTMREAAEVIGIDVGNLSRIENSQAAPPKSSAKIIRICRDLGIEEERAEILISAAYNFHLGALQERFYR